MEKHQTFNSICLLILTIIALAVVLATTKVILIPFTMALFISLLYSPVILYFQNHFKFPRILVLFCLLSIFVGVIILVSSFIAGSIDDFLQSANQYKTKLDLVIVQVTDKIGSLGIDIGQEKIKSYITNLPILGFIKNLTGSMLALASNTFLVIIFTLFLLTGESVSEHKIKILEEIKTSIGKYIGTKLLTSAATATLSYIVFKFFSIEMAFLFAMLTFLLNFIPNIGSLIAIAIPLPIILLQYGIHFQFPLILCLLISLQVLIGNIIEPKLMGESMDLHPVTILLFLTFWGFIWGISGMFLSVPITATLKIIFSKFSLTRPISELFAGRVSS